MLLLDFINVGNGDAILVREQRDGETVFSLLVDCGHDALVRDDHPQELDPRSMRIFAGEFLKRAGVPRLDLLLITHFHRDHVGGLGRVLDAVHVDTLLTPYLPPENCGSLDPDGNNGLNSTSRNVLRCMDFFALPLWKYRSKIRNIVELPGTHRETYHLTEELTMDVDFAESSVYEGQRAVYNAAYRGERDRYALMHWGKFHNVSSLRQRLYYHGKEIVLGGDFYGALWDRDTTSPCDILKLPHHGTLMSCNRKFLSQLQPKTIVISVAAGRPDERPHPFIISLLREFTDDLHFTDAVDIPGLVEPVFHHSVHMEIP